MSVFSALFFRTQLFSAFILEAVGFGLKTFFGTFTAIIFLLFIGGIAAAFRLQGNVVKAQSVAQDQQQTYLETQEQKYASWTENQIAKWEYIVSVVPSRVAYSYLAELYDYVGQKEYAQTALGEARKLDPNFFFGHFPTSN